LNSFRHKPLDLRQGDPLGATWNYFKLNGTFEHPRCTIEHPRVLAI
jgi:hypothetical protein